MKVAREGGFFDVLSVKVETVIKKKGEDFSIYLDSLLSQPTRPLEGDTLCAFTSTESRVAGIRKSKRDLNNAWWVCIVGKLINKYPWQDLSPWYFVRRERLSFSSLLLYRHNI